jgi:uncharacterized protein YbjT (DUF2867 family)
MTDIGNKKILVTGATGNQGGAVARKLLEDGFQVRALTRKPSKDAAKELASLGVEVVKGDLNDTASLARALEDVYGVFGVITPFEEGVAGEMRQGRNLVYACKAAGIKHLVYSSVAGADLKTGIPHFDSKNEIERYIKTIGLPATVLRPVFFMYNFNSDYMGTRQSILDGRLMVPISGDKQLQMVAVEDFAEFVSLALKNPLEYIGKTLEIAGDELSMNEAARTFSRVTSRMVSFSSVPLENIRESNPDMAKMFEWLDNVGYSVDIPSLRAIHPLMMTLETWLHAKGWTDIGLLHGRKAA